VKEAVSIPVIGNGDVTHPALADVMMNQTGCDAVMIGRGSQGNPWLFSAIAAQWGHRGHWNPAPDWNDLLHTTRCHLEMFANSRPATIGHYRKLLLWYSKGCRNSSHLRQRLIQIDKREDILSTFENWVEEAAAADVSFISSKIPHHSVSVPLGVGPLL
jgi:tRNA-dihydrouridine synthase B